jgi:prepilin-type N-terminal cleavage/methylation domain-containing protein
MSAGRGERERGFTLPEVVMAVTILGIIGVTIGAIVTAAFSSTTGVRHRYDASRAAKQASAYWTPDVQAAETVNKGGIICGSGGRDLVTFGWTDFPPVTADRSPREDGGTPRITTWWLDPGEPARVVRRACAEAAPSAPTDTVPITARLTGDGAVAVECSDGGAFRACRDDDDPTALRIRADVRDTPLPTPAGGLPRFTTYTFTVVATREVR